MRSILDQLVEDRIVVRDHCSATVIRDDIAVGFTESMRDGRAAHASVENGVVMNGLVGKPPQNEAGTLETACILVDALNSLGGCWNIPEIVDISYIDARVTDDVGNILNLQVTRACTSKKFWEQAARAGQSSSERQVGEVADELRASIRKKESIPGAVRADLVLVISALDSPGHAMPDVIRAFAELHRAEVEGLGFAQVWVVGPHTGLCFRLA